MPSPTFIAGSELWTTIRRLAARPRGGRKQVAVAYVGPRSVGQLGLREGDALHCALSLRNARAGVVCPSELIELRRRGVRLYADEQLHAKIYLLGRVLIVGSANASRHSAALDEAALLTRDRHAVAAAAAWFDERQDEEISDAFLKKCAEAYRPATWNPFSDAGAKDRRRTARGADARSGHARPRNDAERWWLLWGIYDTDFSPREEEVAEAAGEDAKRRVDRSRWRALEPISWCVDDRVTREIRDGDKLVCICQRGRGKVVTPWGTLIRVRRWRGKTGKQRAMLIAEFPESEADLAYSEFVKRARRAGLSVPERGRTQHFDDATQVRELRRLTSARSLAR